MTAKLGTREKLLLDNFGITLDENRPYLKGILEDTSDIISVTKARNVGISYIILCRALLDTLGNNRDIFIVFPSNRMAHTFYISQYLSTKSPIIKEPRHLTMVNDNTGSTIHFVSKIDEEILSDKCIYSVYFDEINRNGDGQSEIFKAIHRNIYSFKLFMSATPISHYEDTHFMYFYNNSQDKYRYMYPEDGNYSGREIYFNIYNPDSRGDMGSIKVISEPINSILDYRSTNITGKFVDSYSGNILDRTKGYWQKFDNISKDNLNGSSSYYISRLNDLNVSEDYLLDSFVNGRDLSVFFRYVLAQYDSNPF